MTNRNFDEWLSKFRPSISSYDYYIDFDKVVKNVDEIKVELNILNSLIGSKNIEEDLQKLYQNIQRHYHVCRYYLLCVEMRFMHRMRKEHFYIILRR